MIRRRNIYEERFICLSCVGISAVYCVLFQRGPHSGSYRYCREGEGGIMQAAKNGGITKVGTVDVRVDWPASPIIPYKIVTTVVSGE